MSARGYLREESWDSLHRSEASSDAGDEDDSIAGDTDEHGSSRTSPALLTVGDVHRALHPLQATADRVGKQVEQFAETLDRLSNKRHERPLKDCRHVLPLVKGYEKIASDTVKRLKKIHEPERQEKLKQSWKRRLRNSSGRSTPLSVHEEEAEDGGLHTTVEDLQRWELERQTWNLLGVMLQIEYPVPKSDLSDIESMNYLNRPDGDADLHRYTSEHAVWNRFLAEDNSAWERHVVVEWLKSSAEASGQNIDLVVEQLESSADRGSGLLAHGWLYTKEAIKGQKRLRSWPQALDPNSPGIDTSLVNSDRTQGLVTQLDPDAVTRQGRTLEKEDISFERATWLACWEMVRRGRKWESIREWCQERVEGWRSIALRGDPRDVPSGYTDDEPSPSASWQSRALWRSMCAAAAKNGGIDEYENAVYGVLSGHLPSVERVSRTWDDYLFAHYNSYILRQFDHYVHSRFPDKLPRTLTEKHDIDTVGGSKIMSSTDIIKRMLSLDITKEEARRPMKMLQGCLITRSFKNFIFLHGIRLAKSANGEEESKIISDMPTGLLDRSTTADITLKDHDLLRILTHMLFIFQDMGLTIGKGDHQYAIENIVVAYVEYLGKAGKQQLLPIYASRLSHRRSVMCMGRQLPFITDTNERHTVMRLMNQYGMNVTGVLNMQLQMIILDTPPNPENTSAYPKLKILDYTVHEPDSIRPIKSSFIGCNISGDEQDLINGFEWYLLLDGHWQETMAVGTILYKHLLRSRGLAAARELSKTVAFSSISLEKTESILGHATDVSRSYDNSEYEPDGHIELRRSTRSRNAQAQKRRRSSSVRRARSERELLLSSSTTFRDLECLFVALDTLEHWKRVADRAAMQADPRHARGWKSEMQKAHDAVETAMEPLLHGWLHYPKDDKEATECEEIRVACLPEIILAYHSVLLFGGRYLSREILLKCMDLAATIASEHSDLADCFVAARRMSELVDSMAVSSKSIVQAEEFGARTGKSRKKLNVESLDIWTVKVPSS